MCDVCCVCCVCGPPARAPACVICRFHPRARQVRPVVERCGASMMDGSPAAGRQAAKRKSGSGGTNDKDPQPCGLGRRWSRPLVLSVLVLPCLVWGDWMTEHALGGVPTVPARGSPPRPQDKRPFPVHILYLEAGTRKDVLLSGNRGLDSGD
jgi:hypothetical protein